MAPTRRVTTRRKKRIQHPNSSRRPALSAAFSNSTVMETVFLVGLVIFVFIVLWVYKFIQLHLEMSDDHAFGKLPQSLPQVLEPPIQKKNKDGGGLRGGNISNNNNNSSPQQSNLGGFTHFLKVAEDLAALTPTETLKQLDGDPFGVRTFDKQLIEQETTLGRTLTIEEIQQLFPCPTASVDRITLPDVRVEQKAKDFRDGKKGTFLFFQHLRKAGGTNFCSLAEKNLPKKAQPHYYCMPDMGWSGNKNAGYLHSWPNEEIISRMEESGFRIAGNEWENFDVRRHLNLPAVFATSFRKPLDRALSQFRFECVEDRGCHIKDVHEFWDTRKDLWNVYTKTFADPPLGARKYFKGDESSNSSKRREFMTNAIGTLSKFHIVLSMEWLSYGAPQVRSILGFDDISALTTRVRPHIAQAKRDDGPSWTPKEYLDAEQYKKMSEDLALDEVLTDVARRMFLERLVCKDVGGGVAIQ